MRGRPFERGNKMGKGRPPGSRNQRTVFSRMMDSYGEALIKQCQETDCSAHPGESPACDRDGRIWQAAASAGATSVGELTTKSRSAAMKQEKAGRRLRG